MGRDPLASTKVRSDRARKVSVDVLRSKVNDEARSRSIGMVAGASAPKEGDDKEGAKLEWAGEEVVHDDAADFAWSRQALVGVSKLNAPFVAGREGEEGEG